MKAKYFLFLLFISALISSCYYDKEEELYPNSFYNDTTTYYYNQDIKPLILANCGGAACHNPGTPYPDLTTYAGLSAKIDRVKVRAINERTMPKDRAMSVADINKLRNWIAAGALNN